MFIMFIKMIRSQNKFFFFQLKEFSLNGGYKYVSGSMYKDMGYVDCLLKKFHIIRKS